MKKILALAITLSLLMSESVIAAPAVSIIPLGGDVSTNAGYVVTVENINPGDTLVFTASKGDVVVDSRSVQATGPVYENRHVFATQTTSGTHKFVVTQNGTEIYNQESRLSLGSGVMDTLNSGSLSAVTLTMQNVVNRQSEVEITLTGIERYATGEVKMSVTGKGVDLATGTGTIANNKAVVVVTILPTDPSIKKIEVTAEWGQRGYTKTVDFPFVVTASQEPESAPAPQLPKTGEAAKSIPIILLVVSAVGLYVTSRMRSDKTEKDVTK